MKRFLYTILALAALAVPALAQGNNYAVWSLKDDFLGGGTFSTSAQPGDLWVITDTSSSGTPTYVRVDHGASTGTFAAGVFKATLAGSTEVENVCLSFGDKLCIDIDKLYGVEFRWRFVGQTGSAKDAATVLSFGVGTDRNDDPEAITSSAMFRLSAASTSMALTVQSDDGTNFNDDIATSITVTDSQWYRSRILFTSGTDDVRFYTGNANANPSASLSRLASGTTFDMSGHTGGLQIIIQLQKSSDSNTDSVEFDLVDCWGPR